MVLYMIGIAVLAVVVFLSVIIGIERHQAVENAKLLDTFNLSEQPSRTLVAYFSRSGNTELMAYRIAELTQAELVTLEANDYKLGFQGWVNAMVDARKTKAVISHEPVDLTAYDTLYIGSPIWLYSPAPPVFEFVGANQLNGKKVVLFNSMNSKFEQRYIDDFAKLVKQQGGEFIKHICINRGRMPRQMSTPAFLDSVSAKVLE